MSKVYRDIILNFETLEQVSQLPKPKFEIVYKKKDYAEVSVEQLYHYFKNGMVEKYLLEKPHRCRNVPIVQNPALK